MVLGTRRSSRANKGQHSKRLLEAVTIGSDDYDSGDEIEELKYVKKKPRRAGGKKDDRPNKKGDANNDDDDDYVQGGESPDVEESEVNCTPCGTNKSNYDENNDKGGTFVLCDQCNTWQHAKCMGYKTSKDIPKSHVCNICLAKRNKEDSSLLIREKLKDEHRVSTALAFYNYFKKSFPPGYEITNEDKEKKVSDWALEIEDIIFTTFPSKMYISEGRRILFLLKKYFMKDIIKETITLEQVVKKTPKEINLEIERVEALNHSNMKNIILTENSATDIIRRTHKGDIIRENENDTPDTIDIGITTKKVDHRRFSVDEDEDVILKPRVVADRQSVSEYNNINPRIEEEDDDEVNGAADVEHNSQDEDDFAAGEATSVDGEGALSDLAGNSNTEKTSRESSELDQVNDLIDDKDLDKIIGIDSEVSVPTPKVWNGFVKFPDFAEFNATGSFYSCTRMNELERSTAVCNDILTAKSYTVMGRLDRIVADKYLTKIMKSRELYFVEIKSLAENDADFSRLYSYLLMQNKVGVLSGKPAFVKDSYLIPIDFRDSRVPDYIQHHKKDMRIGLFAVFVVKSEYVPKELKQPSSTFGRY
ncbi:hypothetical protein DFJ63DRAFT_186085 [Scheffersomyces coipomensis]|uniref:uncharacterized protein n=1 Tax=Scheffersomyces coipomensis TaxID=1788519 RepID=UPI00315D5880